MAPAEIDSFLQVPHTAVLSTMGRGGFPHLVGMWFLSAGDELRMWTYGKSQKAHNLRRDPRIIVSVQSRSDPQAYAVFHGKARVTEAGADEHIDKLAKRFLGADKYPFRQPGEKRLLVRTSVDRIGGFGPGMQPWS